MKRTISRRAALKAGSAIAASAVLGGAAAEAMASIEAPIVALYEKRAALNSTIAALAFDGADGALGDSMIDGEWSAANAAIEEEHYRNPSPLSAAAWIIVGELWEQGGDEPIDERFRKHCEMVLPSLPAGKIRDHIAEIVENPAKPAGQMAFWF